MSYLTEALQLRRFAMLRLICMYIMYIENSLDGRGPQAAGI